MFLSFFTFSFLFFYSQKNIEEKRDEDMMNVNRKEILRMITWEWRKNELRSEKGKKRKRQKIEEKGNKREERMTEYIRRDPIREYRPLPVFSSVQIGDCFVENSLEYIRISLDPSRGSARVTNGLALKTPRRYFMYVGILVTNPISPFSPFTPPPRTLDCFTVTFARCLLSPCIYIFLLFETLKRITS